MPEGVLSISSACSSNTRRNTLNRSSVTVIEKNMLKSDTEANDTGRIVLYGEKVLQRESPPDQGDVLQVLDRVMSALVEKKDIEQSKRAIAYAKRYEDDDVVMRKKMEPPGHLSPGAVVGRAG